MSVAGRLWKAAPAWRASFIIALCATALVAIFPPGLGLRTGAPGNTAAPVSSSYAPAPAAPASPQQQAARPQPTPARPPAPTAPRSPGAKYADQVQDQVPFGGRTIPLPSGTWRVIASLPGTAQNGLATDSQALAHEVNGKLVGLVILVGNDKTTPSATGYRADGNCERSDMIFTHVAQNSDFGEQDCQYINFMVPEDVSKQTPGDALLRAAFGDLKERNVAAPQVLVGVSFRFATRRDILIARYYFSPDADGIPPSEKTAWLDNDWNKYNLARHPDKQKYIERVKTWLARWQPVIDAAWNEKPLAVIDAHDRKLPD